MDHRVSSRHGLPFWVTRSYGATPPAPPAVSPADKSGRLVDLAPHISMTMSGSDVTQVDDQCGNARHATFAAGKYGLKSAAFYNGLDYLQYASTTLGIFSTDNMIAPGSAFGTCTVFAHATEPGTYYHIQWALRTATANKNVNLLISNDGSYGVLNLGFTSGNMVRVASPTVSLTSGVPVVALISYNGGTQNATSSWEIYLNNELQTLSSATGASGNDSNGNYLNSFANTSPPAFPATGSKLGRFTLYNSVISSTERTDVFKVWAQDTMGITQA